MQRVRQSFVVVALLSLVACGSPAATQAPVEGTPNEGGEAPLGAGKTIPQASTTSRTTVTKPALPALTEVKPPAIPTDTGSRIDKKRNEKRDRLNSNPALAPAKKIAREVASAIIAKDVERARALFLPEALINKIFPGDACAKERESGEKERQRMERKLPGILRRGARFLIHGPDNLDGKVEPAQEAKVTLRLRDVMIRRSKTIPKGKTSKRGCTMQETLVGSKVRLNLVAAMDGREVAVPINIQVLKVGEKGWFLAEL